MAWNPEFLREGFAVEDTLHPDRLVVGTASPRAEELLREVYAPIIAEGVPFLVTDFPTAELVKVAANSFLATKISFINAMAEVCEAAGADVTQLATAIGYDPRIGSRFLAAGLGFGGGCLPKDIRAFMARAGELGAEDAVAFLREVDQINLRRRAATVDLAREALGGAFRGHRITVLGATFKPDSDDVRDSPSLDVAVAMSNAGADVVVHDPKGLVNAERVYPHLTYVADLRAALAGAELVVLGTEWREYRELDPRTITDVVADRHVIDGRNALDPQAWRERRLDVPGARPPHRMNRPEEIRDVLTGSRTWFVVGLGDNPDRDAFGVARYLQQQGKRIVPVHPRAQTVHGEQGYATIAEAAAELGAARRRRRLRELQPGRRVRRPGHRRRRRMRVVPVRRDRRRRRAAGDRRGPHDGHGPLPAGGVSEALD